MKHSTPDYLTTERLVLRKYKPADAQQVYNLVADNKLRLEKNFSLSVGSITNIKSAEKTIRQWNSEWYQRKNFYFGLWDKSAAHYMGQISLKNIEWAIPKAEIGYYISCNYEGRGLMTEALKAIQQLAFEQLHIRKLYLRIFPENIRSENLALKNGFLKEGIHRKEFKTKENTMEDVCYYGMIEEDYYQLKSYKEWHDYLTKFI